MDAKGKQPAESLSEAGESIGREPIAPEPALASATIDDAQPNPWLSQATIFPIQAFPWREWRQLEHRKSTIAPSNFYSGFIQIEETGIRLSSDGRSRLNGRIRMILLVLSAASVLLLLGVRLQLVSLMSHSALGTVLLTVIPMLILLGCGLYLAHSIDYQEVPKEFWIAWDNVRELQVESQSRWACLLYDSDIASDKYKGQTVVNSLSINPCYPSNVVPFAEAIERHIPDRVHRNLIAYEWTMGARIAAALAILGVLALVAAIYDHYFH